MSSDDELSGSNGGERLGHRGREEEAEQSLDDDDDDTYDMCSLSSSTDDLQDRHELDDEVYELLQHPSRMPSRQIGARGGPTIKPSNFDHSNDGLSSDTPERHHVSTCDRERGLGDHPAAVPHGACDLDLPEHYHCDKYLGLCHGTTDQFAWHMEPCGHVVTEHRGLGTIMFEGERFPQKSVPQPGGDCGHDTWAIAVVRAELSPNQLAYLAVLGKLDNSLRAELSQSQRACLTGIGDLDHSPDRRRGYSSRQVRNPQMSHGKYPGQRLFEDYAECRDPYRGHSWDEAFEDESCGACSGRAQGDRGAIGGGYTSSDW